MKPGVAWARPLKCYNLSEEALERLAYATVTTSKGKLVFKLFPGLFPETVANFAHLAEKEFYQKQIFHRMELGRLIQGGCPEGSGKGHPGWRIADEFRPEARHRKGALAMATAEGKDSAGSQFYIALGEMPELDGKFAVFGYIEPEDLDSLIVLDALIRGDRIRSVEISALRP